MLTLKCLKCGTAANPREYVLKCPACGGILVPTVERIRDLVRSDYAGVWSWRKYLMDSSSTVTLGEGNTPLIRSTGIGAAIGVADVFIKNESRNPTGTFLDRGSATLTSAALNFGVRKLVIASLGDLGISVASYGRRAKLKSLTYLPLTVAPSKAYQTLLLSDKVVFVSSYEEAVRRALRHESADVMPVTPQNPYLLEGYRTIYYEVFYTLRKHPDFIVVPIGDGGLYTMLWVALNELGGDSVVVGVKGKRDSPLMKDIAVEKPLLWDLVEMAVRDCDGFIVEVDEEDIIEAARLLAKKEGMLAEPAGAAAIAALIKAHSKFDRKSSIVAIVTGAALTDTAALKALIGRSIELMDVQKIGFTKALILEILVTHGPLHAYALWKVIREYHGLRISLRALYQHMKELEDLGMVKVVAEEVVEGRRRKVYEVTEKGIKAIS
ncbi:MAG: pyridoxal-phosphate dependent enzyme [Desulfurococcales archaeon]|nr:pyridoxal-phosphate dependent enzyme [Desulfurococcales archaeon]